MVEYSFSHEHRKLLKSKGLSDEHIDLILKHSTPDPSKVHMKCPECRALHEYTTGEAIESCVKCNYCRHTVVDGSIKGRFCRDCNMKDPVIPILNESHFYTYDHLGNKKP